jgi:PAS domain S-box-containing protein
MSASFEQNAAPLTAVQTERAYPSVFAGAVRDSQLAMVVTDARSPDQPIVFANDAFLALTGYAREEVLGRNCRFMQGAGTDPADVARIRDVVRHGRADTVDVLNYRKDGTPFWNALYISPVRDDGGEPIYFFGAQLDITERKRTETALLSVKDGLEAAVAARTADLEAALESKTALLHEVDHRVKNNLQLIASLMMLQIRRTPDDAAKAALKSMLARISAVSTVHRRLFQAVDVERFDVAAFLQDMVEDRFGLTAADEALDLDVQAASLPNNKAAPLALIVSELFNFVMDPEGSRPTLRLTAGQQGSELCITVEGAAALGDGDAFGREIVDLLARQLQGKAKFEELNGRRRAYLLLPLDGTE